MQAAVTFRLRALYQKQGRLVMLSHLEVAEALRRVVRRADLPFCVTQGFSPHMKMTYSAALPVGVGSTCEIFDLIMPEYVDPALCLERLQAASVPDLNIVSCKYVEKKAKAASVAYPIGCFVAAFDGDCADLALPEQLTVVRAGKKPKTQVVADYLRGDVVRQGNKMLFALEALPNGALRPDNLLREALALRNAAAESVAAAPAAPVQMAPAGLAPEELASPVAPAAAAGGLLQPATLHLISCTRVDQRDQDNGSLLASMA